MPEKTLSPSQCISEFESPGRDAVPLSDTGIFEASERSADPSANDGLPVPQKRPPVANCDGEEEDEDDAISATQVWSY